MRATTGLLAALTLALAMTPAAAQSINVSRSILADRPYTVIYPEVLSLMPGGNADEVLLLNHPDVPLQCSLAIVDVEEEQWSAEAAVAALDDAALEALWSADFPGFTLRAKGVTQYQSGPALIYEGASESSPFGLPLEVVHTETVVGNLGYVLECLFAAELAEELRPLVDFVVANFSTRSDGQLLTPPAP